MNNEEIDAEVLGILRSSLLPASPSQVEKWRLLARNIARVESIAEGLHFIEWAIAKSDKEGVDRKWPEDYRQLALRWRNPVGAKWRARHAEQPQGQSNPQQAG